jgi:hypothetical protein
MIEVPPVLNRVADDVNVRRLREMDTKDNAMPIDISMKALLEKAEREEMNLLGYDNIEMLANRTYNPVTQKTRNQVLEENPSDRSRFRFFLCKGPKQFNELLTTYKASFTEGKQQIVESESFHTMVVERFYQHIFKQEDDLINTIKEDDSLWHLVLVGWRHHTFF